MRRSLIGACLALALTFGADAASAQIHLPGGGTPFPGGRGGRGGPRRDGPSWTGSDMPQVPDLRNPLRLILANDADLKLTPEQKQGVDSLARALDRQNDTLVAAVRRAFGQDSLLVGGSELPPPRSPEEATVLRDRLNALKPVIKTIRDNDDAAWKSAGALLTKDQRRSADRIRKDDEKAWRGQGSWPRRQGGRRGGGDFPPG